MLLRIPDLATEHKTLQKAESVDTLNGLGFLFTNERQTLSLHDTLSSKVPRPPTNRLGEVI
jgi:hypothetical protein